MSSAFRRFLAVGLTAGSVVLFDTPLAAAAPTRPLPTVDSPEVRGMVSEYGMSAAAALKRISLQYDADDIVKSLQQALGDKYAGVSFDIAAGRFKIGALPGVNVLGVMRTAGIKTTVIQATDAVPARWSWAQLLEAQHRWNAVLASKLAAGTYGTAPDASSNAVSVVLSAAVKQSDRASVQSAAQQDSVTVNVSHDSKLSLSIPAMSCSFPNCGQPLRGGVLIYGGGQGCTDGFLTYSLNNGAAYAMTAGHCLINNPGSTWYANHPSAGQQVIGGNCCSFVNASGDAGLVTINQGGFWALDTPDAVVWGGPEDYPIYGTTNGYKGLYECHVGATSGTDCGTDAAVNASQPIGYAPPLGTITVNGLTVNSACTSRGDSGGPWLSQYYGTGIDIAGNQCPTATSYYEPAAYAAQHLGVTVGGG